MDVTIGLDFGARRSFPLPPEHASHHLICSSPPGSIHWLGMANLLLQVPGIKLSLILGFHLCRGLTKLSEDRNLVLIIEDTKSFSAVLCAEISQRRQYDIICAESYAEAKKVLEEQSRRILKKGEFAGQTLELLNMIEYRSQRQFVPELMGLSYSD